MKRQTILLIVLSVIAVVCISAYFVLNAQLFSEEPAGEEDDTPKVELEDGEQLHAKDQVFMFNALSRGEIETITVDNSHGGFVFVNDGKGEFYIKGYDSALFDETLFANLLNVTSYSLSKTKVGSDLSKEKIAEYGLDEPQASWTVKGFNGDWYKVWVGDRIIPGNGYYCKLDGRESVYVLSENIGATVLVPIEEYVTPLLCGGIDQNDYYTVEDFTVYKHGEKLFSLELLEKEEQENKEALAEVMMNYPATYYPNSAKYFEIIYSYMSLFADSCHKLGANEEDLEAVGLSDPATRITFDYNGATLDLRFSEMNEDGNYYVWSVMSPNIIGVCDGSKFDYLEYRLIDWIDSHLFQRYLVTLSDMTVTTPERTVEFKFSHSVAADGDPILRITANGEEFEKSDVDNFRQYYQTFYAIAVQDYCSSDSGYTMTDEERDALISDPSNATLTFSYKTLSGDEVTLSFYQYTTGHSLVTVDGKGEFYVYADTVEKVVNDTERLMNGEPIEAWGKN